MGTSSNTTHAPSHPSSSAGPAAGLTVFFLLLAIIVGVIIYKYHGAIMNMVPFRQRKVQEKEDHTETPQDDPHECTDMVREQSVGPCPIYENLKTQTTGYNVAAANQSRFPVESEDDVYLQCDAVDEGIYSNDPAHDTMLTGSQEDVYIVPD